MYHFTNKNALFGELVKTITRHNHETVDELADINPAYFDSWAYVGDEIYGIPDDGDVHILYYRTDLFEDPDNMEGFQAEYGYDLAPPETWDQWTEICQFFTYKHCFVDTICNPTSKRRSSIVLFHFPQYLWQVC